MVINLIEKIPGLREAVEKETVSRDAAFLCLIESINSFDVLPMTLRHYVTLRSVGSPVMNGEIPSPIELFTFLWILSPHFQPIDCEAKTALYDKLKALDIEGVARTITAAREYWLETFFDAKTSRHGNGDTHYFSDACAICAMFGREYGWSMEVTMALPMKCVLQFQKEIKQQHGGVLGNPSDILKSRYLDSLNQKARNQ
jgi:hypothetical protein